MDLAMRSTSVGEAGRRWVCASSTYCKRCSRLRKKTVGSHQFVVVFLGNQAQFHAHLEHIHCAAQLQFGFAAAADQLKRLGREFNFTNAATAQFHVHRARVLVFTFADFTSDLHVQGAQGAN